MRKKEELYSGKAKTVYRTEDPSKLIIEFRDSLTAFDGKKKSSAPKKGFYNAQISSRLFEVLEDRGIKTHYLGMISETEMLVSYVDIIKIEVIVRNIAAGSMVKKYPFEEGQRLVPPVLIFDYKSDEYGDPMINDDLALALGLASRDELAAMREISLRVNSILTSYLGERGLVLPDLKLEFGRRGGEIVVADEISCDTCRLWDRETGESLDKDVFRFGKGDVVAAYREVARRVVQGIFE
jgi:phosphoribosylaminoimidazole-succinocarboxamide synthase